jgi:hypothetical protein
MCSDDCGPTPEVFKMRNLMKTIEDSIVEACSKPLAESIADLTPEQREMADTMLANAEAYQKLKAEQERPQVFVPDDYEVFDISEQIMKEYPDLQMSDIEETIPKDLSSFDEEVPHPNQTVLQGQSMTMADIETIERKITSLENCKPYLDTYYGPKATNQAEALGYEDVAKLKAEQEKTEVVYDGPETFGELSQAQLEALGLISPNAETADSSESGIAEAAPITFYDDPPSCGAGSGCCNSHANFDPGNDTVRLPFVPPNSHNGNYGKSDEWEITYTHTIKYTSPTPHPATVTGIMLLSRVDAARLGYETNIDIACKKNGRDLREVDNV